MLRDRGRDLESIDLLFGNLFGMRTHDEMHLMRAAIDLIQQPLQVDRSARARGSNDQFHLKKFAVSLNSIGNRGNKVIMVKKLLHTRYRVTDLEKTVSFYKDVLGLKETARHTSGRGSQLVFLKAPESEEEIELCKFDESGPVVVGPDLTHLAFEVVDLDKFAKEAARKGYPLSDGPHQGGSGRIAFIDAPEGYEIELIERRK